MDVIAGLLEVVVIWCDQLGFVAAGEHVTSEAMSSIEAGGVSSKEPFHAAYQVRLGGFHHQMKMIWKKAVRVHLPGGFLARSFEGFEESVPVLVIPKHILGSIATAGEKVDRSRDLNS